MNFDYLESAQDGLELLAEFGGAEPGLVFTRAAKAGPYVPGANNGPGAPLTWPGVGLIFPYPDRGASARPDLLVQAGDQKAYVAALAADGTALRAPAKPDKCLAPNGVLYSVENVDALAPAGQVVLYEIQLRR